MAFVGGRGGLGLQKPLKMEMEEPVDLQQMMGIYRRPRLNFPTVTGVRASDFVLSSPIQPQIIESVTLKPMTTYEVVDHHQMLRDQMYKGGLNGLGNVPNDDDQKMAKMRSIRYDYSGFKPIGPGTTSPMIYTSYSGDSYPPLVNQTYFPLSSTPDAPTDSAVPVNTSSIHVDSPGPGEVTTPRDGKSFEMSVESAETFTTSMLFHPEKVEPDNKIILPVNPTDLLRLVSEETRGKDTRAECTNRDLGWCDLGEHYPT